MFDGDSDKFYLKKTDTELKSLHIEQFSQMLPSIYGWKRIFKRLFNVSNKLKYLNINLNNMVLKSRFPNYMSKFFYKKIFRYKYKLFLYFKSKLSSKFSFFFKFIKFLYNPFILNLKMSLLTKKNSFVNKEFLSDSNIFWSKFLYSFYFKSIFSLHAFSKKFGFLFKIYDLINFKNLNFQHLFFKNQLLFYNQFFKNNFFFSLLVNFFKQLSFLVIPSSFHKLRKKQVHVFSSFVLFDIDLLDSLITRFRFEQFDNF